MPGNFKIRSLAGLQAGVLGGVAMLFYFSVDAMMRRQRWSHPEVLLGSAIYGNYALWNGGVKVILAGMGFQLFVAGLAGVLCSILFSQLRPSGSGLTTLLASLAFALAWYWLWYGLVLPALAPLIPLYVGRATAIAAHLLLGLMLSRIPVYLRDLVMNQPDIA